MEFLCEASGRNGSCLNLPKALIPPAVVATDSSLLPLLPEPKETEGMEVVFNPPSSPFPRQTHSISVKVAVQKPPSFNEGQL